ncbi:hypothetical protein K501DRAFT_287060 [Backusella circina FSU 941]|nr:hypothetical protein K501DRAFT_287059 [Backusella circina FSU 941]KAI8880095.1 hypothetical protein K501DRAFT_287060 [Backusella circina FSU 941]
MSMPFLYEDGQGHVVDEHGVEPMDLVVGEELFAIETLSSRTQFQPVERNSEEKIQQRYDWVQKWQQTDLDFTTNCVFLDESAFHINLKRGMA